MRRSAVCLSVFLMALACSRQRGSGRSGAEQDGLAAGGSGGDPTPAPDAAAGGSAGPAPAAIDRDHGYPDRTEVSYLSGLGIDDAVPWDFSVTGGRRAGEAATIPVPSNWELHGFGSFHYGSEPRTTEQGIYKRAFDIPAAWSGKRIFITFEGAMTDAAVTVNGQSAGPPHQGAFYRFRYDITSLVKVGAANQLEVRVAKESADPSVNEAERAADYWTFGGIFRPVYLEAFPASSIERLAIDARADGTLGVEVFLREIPGAHRPEARVLDETLSPVGPTLSAAAEAGQDRVKLTGGFPGIKTWSAETPTGTGWRWSFAPRAGCGTRSGRTSAFARWRCVRATAST